MILENMPEWKLSALKRDGFKCMDCGKTDKEVRLHVHHLDLNGRSSNRSSGGEDNSLDNLITVCPICHSKRHNIPCRPDKDLRLMVEMRNQGITYREIGELFGVSRQRIHQLLNGYYANDYGNFVKPRAEQICPLTNYSY